MLSRILLSTVAAASLAAAAPALAGGTGEDAERRDVPRCCDHLAMHMYGVAPQEATDAAEAPARTKDKTIQNPLDEDPDVRNQSWGG
jgi:hypothetical protein